MDEIINHSEASLLRLETPYHKGNGCLLKESELIVTHARIVEDYPIVLACAEQRPRRQLEVCLVDSLYDLAFLKCGQKPESTGLTMRKKPLSKGESVLAIGFSPDRSLVVREGKVIACDVSERGIQTYRHDAVLPSGNTGGPLLDLNGRMAGINVFDLLSHDLWVRTIPSTYVLQLVECYRDKSNYQAARCPQCKALQFEEDTVDGECTECGAEVIFPHQWESYQPEGMSDTIERMLDNLGFSPELNRQGPDNWRIKRGSASIHISYHKKTGMIVGDAALCRIGENTSGKIYEHLLEANYALEHLTFSVRDRRVILSLLIYDRYFSVATGTRLFDYLFTKSDEYDDVLVREYGAKWLKEGKNIRT